MKSQFIALSFSALVAASPATVLPRQRTGTTANEFVNGGCAENIFVFSRGSTERGNMGTICGPPTADGLKSALGAGNVAVQGVDYAAALNTNFLPGGADPAGITTMAGLINQAATQCPDSTLLVAGYSQGAAMVHRVVESLDPAVSAKVAGVVTFGDTQNQQDNGQINNYPPDQTLVICNDGDLVCEGTLTIRAPHLQYERRTPEAIDFLVAKANGAAAARKMKRGL